MYMTRLDVSLTINSLLNKCNRRAAVTQGLGVNLSLHAFLTQSYPHPNTAQTPDSPRSDQRHKTVQHTLFQVTNAGIELLGQG